MTKQNKRKFIYVIGGCYAGGVVFYFALGILLRHLTGEKISFVPRATPWVVGFVIVLLTGAAVNYWFSLKRKEAISTKIKLIGNNSPDNT